NDPAVLALFPANNSEEGREEAALVGMVEALVTLVEARDYSTGRHSHQVADLVLRLTRALGLPPSEAQMIALAGRLHDVGTEAIPFGARILTVVDAYLAMTVDRPYQKACAPLDALTELCRCAGSQFDPHVVEAATFLLQPPEQSCELPLRK